MNSTQYYIFISYSHSDSSEVEKLTNFFDQNNIEYWIDYKSIRLGEKYQADIVRGIESCAIFLFVYSNSSNESEDQIKELGIASNAKKRIIPFMLDNSKWRPDLRYMAGSNQGIEVWKTGMDFALKALYYGINNHQEKEDLSPLKPETPLKSRPTMQEKDDDLDYEDALAFVELGELQKAIHSLQLSFEYGNSNTINLFNKILFKNFGNIDWDDETWDFFKEQAEGGYSFAHLAYFYKLQHNKETFSQAWKHLRAARVDKKNGYATLCEGIAYVKGIGVTPDLTKATMRFSKAYEVGIWESCSYLAEMYLSGHSGEKVDKKKAIEVLNEGQNHDDARSWYVLGSIYEEKAYIKENWEKAVGLFKKSVELHMYEAWINLGNLYNYNRFSDDYKDEALSCYLEALKNGNKDAHAYIAKQYWEKGRQEDAIIEASKGEKVGNTLSISTLGRFYEEGLQEEGHWIRKSNPDYSKAWNYYRKAFQMGGHIEDAISMARLYVKKEYVPDEISWETIQGYLEEGSKVPIREALELMIEVLRKNGKEEEVVKYLKIGAESGSLSMKHEYGIRLLSSESGTSLKLIEEAGENKYQPSVEWLIDYYKSPQTYSKIDYGKWMEIGADMGIEVSPDDYIPYLIETNPSKAKDYLLKKYADNDVEYLLWTYKYYIPLNINKHRLLAEFKSVCSKSKNNLLALSETYADFLLRNDFSDEFEEFYMNISMIDSDEGRYFVLLKEVYETKELNKELALKIMSFSRDESVSNSIRIRSRILLQNYLSRKKKSKILVADAYNSNVLLLKILFTNEGYDVCTAYSGVECIELAQRENPDMILMEVVLPEMNGFDVAVKLKSNPVTKNIPIIFLTRINTPADLVRGYQVGAADFLSKPFNKEELYCRTTHQLILSKLAKIVPTEQRDDKKKKKILIVDDVSLNVLFAKVLFNKEGYDVCTADSGQKCIELAQREPPDIILLDIMLPDLNGYDVAKLLKKDPKTWDIPILFLTALNAPSDLVHGFQAGASDFISKPFSKEELVMRVNKILTVNELISIFSDSC